MWHLGKIFSTRSQNRSHLSNFLESSREPIGSLILEGHKLQEMIAQERDIPTLVRVVDRARETGDLKWAIAAGEKMLELGADNDIKLEHVRNLIWAKHVVEAHRLFTTLPVNQGLLFRYYHTAFQLDIIMEQFASARQYLTQLEALQPADAPDLHQQLILRLIGTGSFVEAEGQLVASLSQYPDSQAIVAAQAQLIFVMKGADFALSHLSNNSDYLKPESELYKRLFASFLIEKGRYNEAFDLLIEWIEKQPQFFSLYSLADMSASHCDRQSEFGRLLDDIHQKYPKFYQLSEMRCNWAVDQNNWDAAEELLPDIKRRSQWASRNIELAIACQQPNSEKVHATFNALVQDGMQFSGPNIMLAFYMYFYQAAGGGVAKARTLIAPFLRENMGDSGFLALHLRLLIAEGLDEEARDFYYSLPNGLAVTAALAPFDMFFQAMDGRHDDARNGWKEYLVDTAHMSLNARSSYPDTIKLRYKEKKGDVLLFLTVFNGAEFTDWFLDYYRNLGVNHFFIVDNGSDDGTFERLLKETDVSLFRNQGSFSQSACGVFWSNHLMRRFGVGHWCFHVDMDEAFVFPDMESGRTLHDLLGYMDKHGYQTIPSIMLDIYPETLTKDTDEDPFECSKYIDTDYFFMRSELPPYNFVQGGIRARLSGRSLLMTKAPLIKMAPDVAYIANNHQHSHLPVADISSVLLHYKFIGDFAGRIDEAIERNEHFMGARFYKGIRSEFIDSDRSDSLLSEFSVSYSGSEHLIELGLMTKSTQWSERT